MSPQYHLTLNSLGYVLAEKPDGALIYERSEITPFGANFSSGQRTMSDIQFWDAWQQTAFNHGIGFRFFEDDESGVWTTGDRVDTRFPEGVSLFTKSTADANLNVACSRIRDTSAYAFAGRSGNSASGTLWKCSAGTWAAVTDGTNPELAIRDLVPWGTYIIFSGGFANPDVGAYPGSGTTWYDVGIVSTFNANYLAIGRFSSDLFDLVAIGNVTAGAAAVSLVDSDYRIETTADCWVGYEILMTQGARDGEHATITDFSPTGDALDWLPAFTGAVGVGDDYELYGNASTYLFATTTSDNTLWICALKWKLLPSAWRSIEIGADSATVPTGICFWDDKVWVATPDGLWKVTRSGGSTYASAPVSWLTSKVLDWSQTYDADNGKYITSWGDHLYFPVRDRLYKWDGSGDPEDVSPPILGDTWPYEPYTDFAWLTPSPSGSQLWMRARAQASSTHDDLLAFDGNYWHKLAELNASAVSPLAVSTVTDKVWYQQSTSTFYIPVRADRDYPYADFPTTGNHYLYLSRITGELDDLDKVVTQVAVVSQGCAAARTIAVEYRVDGYTWQSAGTVTTSPRQELTVGAAATGTADAGSGTTALVDAARTEATTDHWKGVYVHMTSGANKGLTRQCSAFTPATDTLTVAAFPSAIAAGDTYELWWYGKRFELRLNIATDNASYTPVLEALSLRTRVRPPMLKAWELALKCENHVQLVDGRGRDSRSAASIRSDLEAARDAIAPVSLVDIDATTYTVYVTNLSETTVRNPRTGGVDSVITLELEEAA